MRLDFSPHLHWSLLALGALLVIALSLSALQRRSILAAAARLTAGAALLLALADPSILQETSKPIPSTFLIVEDVSNSMQSAQRSKLASNAADNLQLKLLNLPNIQVKRIRSGNQRSNLFTDAQQALALTPPQQFAGAAFFTDGQISDIPQELTPPFKPIHIILPDKPREHDRVLRVLKSPQYGVVEENVEVVVVVDDNLAPPDQPLTLTLSYNDSSQSRSVSPGRPETFSLPLRHAGDNTFSFSVKPHPNEISAQNNHTVVSVNAVRDRLRVLLISGSPHPGGRGWRNLLKSDPAVELVHFTILRFSLAYDPNPPDKIALIPYPADQLFIDNINEFNLIIFDRFLQAPLGNPKHLENIIKHVRNGGALLAVGGPVGEQTNNSSGSSLLSNFPFLNPSPTLDSSPLNSVLPAQPLRYADVPFVPAVTPQGHKHPVTTSLPASPPWSPWFRYAQTAQHNGDALLAAPNNQPLLLLRRFGDGRVAQLLSDQIWLWARRRDGGGPHGELMRRLVHWLLKRPELEENSLFAHVKDNRVVVTQRSLLDNPPNVRLISPSKQSRVVPMQNLSPGSLQGSLPILEQGLHSVVSNNQTIPVVNPDSQNPEYLHLLADADAIKPLVQRSGGAVFSLSSTPNPNVRIAPNSSRAFGSNWLGARPASQQQILHVKRAPLLVGAIPAALLILALCLAWLAERRSQRSL